MKVVAQGGSMDETQRNKDAARRFVDAEVFG
jgi:hypothetical protein